LIDKVIFVRKALLNQYPFETSNVTKMAKIYFVRLYYSIIVISAMITPPLSASALSRSIPTLCWSDLSRRYSPARGESID